VKKRGGCCSTIVGLLRHILLGQCLHWCDCGLFSATVAVLFENTFLMVFGLLTANVLHLDETRGTFMILCGELGIMGATIVLAFTKNTKALVVAMVLLGTVACFWFVSIVLLLFNIEHELGPISPPPPPPLPSPMPLIGRSLAAAAAPLSTYESARYSTAALLAHSSSPSPPIGDGSKSFGELLKEWTVTSYDVICIVTQMCTIVNHALLMVYIYRDLIARGSILERNESDLLLRRAKEPDP